MYEALEHWNQYKQEKELQKKISKEYQLEIISRNSSSLYFFMIYFYFCFSGIHSSVLMLHT